jgi:phage-related protein
MTTKRLVDMSKVTYHPWSMPKPLVWLHGEVKTLPLSREARVETGTLLRRLQEGEVLEMPLSRPMPGIARHCHELRTDDSRTGRSWRLVYRVDRDAMVVGGVFPKTTQRTPRRILEACRVRFRRYDLSAGEE